MDAAFEKFVEHGLEQAGMREIIRKSGGSYSTVYRWFGSKDGLFIAAIEHKMKKLSLDFENIAKERKDAPIEECLKAFALKLLDVIFDEKFILVFQRILNAGLRKDPKFGCMLKETATKGHMLVLANYVKAQQEKGALREGDPFAAAARFVGCVKDPRHIHAIITGKREAMDSAQRETIAQEAARFFLYGFSA
ncbi:MAG: TetR/AcrR family transcriptional regulator [Helicobacteraceae bacterium]|nr:TetR/AcrR family transcriptional regulator [Helicobacteraceae bacterium]